MVLACKVSIPSPFACSLRCVAAFERKIVNIRGAQNVGVRTVLNGNHLRVRGYRNRLRFGAHGQIEGGNRLDVAGVQYDDGYLLCLKSFC